MTFSLSHLKCIVIFLLMSFFVKGQNDLYDKGMHQLRGNNYESAVKFFSQAIEKNQKDYASYYQRSCAYQKLKKYQEMFNDLNKCIDINGSFPEAYWSRGELLFLSAKYFDFLNDENMAVKYAKENDTIRNYALISRSSAKLSLRNFSGAREDCLEILKRDSLNVGVIINLSSSYNEAEELEKSLFYLLKALKIDSTNPIAISNIGYQYGQLGKYEESLKYLNISVRNEPKNAFAYSNRSYALMKIGKIKEAFKDINTSIDLDAANSYAYRNLGLIYLEDKNKTKACEAFNTAIKKGFSEMYGNEVKELIKKNCP